MNGTTHAFWDSLQGPEVLTGVTRTHHRRAPSVVHTDTVLSDKSREAKHAVGKWLQPTEERSWREGPGPSQLGRERGAQEAEPLRHWQRP